MCKQDMKHFNLVLFWSLQEVVENTFVKNTFSSTDLTCDHYGMICEKTHWTKVFVINCIAPKHTRVKPYFSFCESNVECNKKEKSLGQIQTQVVTSCIGKHFYMVEIYFDIHSCMSKHFHNHKKQKGLFWLLWSTLKQDLNRCEMFKSHLKCTEQMHLFKMPWKRAEVKL